MKTYLSFKFLAIIVYICVVAVAQTVTSKCVNQVLPKITLFRALKTGFKHLLNILLKQCDREEGLTQMSFINKNLFSISRQIYKVPQVPRGVTLQKKDNFYITLQSDLKNIYIFFSLKKTKKKFFPFLLSPPRVSPPPPPPPPEKNPLPLFDLMSLDPEDRPREAEMGSWVGPSSSCL